jgi:hypothetical protein
VRGTLEDVRRLNLKVVPQCRFVRAVIERQNFRIYCASPFSRCALLPSRDFPARPLLCLSLQF